LLYARKVQRRASTTGFDYQDLEAPLAHLEQELHELRAEIAEAGLPAAETEPDARIADELGDVLFVLVGVAAKLNVDPELALRQTTQKFVTRVELAADRAAERGENWTKLDLDAQLRYYDEAKEALR
jgi:nucleoside triphosphate diphosphatase